MNSIASPAKTMATTVGETVGETREFSYSAYREIVTAFLKKGYLTVFFPQATELIVQFAQSAQSVPFLLLRHDIDIELERALALAQIEADLGVRSTFFFLLRTENYNLFSQKGTAIIEAILKLGHALGLHFDCAAYTELQSPEEIGSACDREAELLSSWFDQPVEVVSFHRPSSLVRSGEPRLAGKRLHTYQKIFTESIQYLSDSTGQWRHGHPLESGAFHNQRPLHLLIHPIWWSTKSISPEQALIGFIQRQREHVEQYLGANCSVFRAKASRT